MRLLPLLWISFQFKSQTNKLSIGTNKSDLLSSIATKMYWQSDRISNFLCKRSLFSSRKKKKTLTELSPKPNSAKLHSSFLQTTGQNIPQQARLYISYHQFFFFKKKKKPWKKSVSFAARCSPWCCHLSFGAGQVVHCTVYVCGNYLQRLIKMVRLNNSLP